MTDSAKAESAPVQPAYSVVYTSGDRGVGRLGSPYIPGLRTQQSQYATRVTFSPTAFRTRINAKSGSVALTKRCRIWRVLSKHAVPPDGVSLQARKLFGEGSLHAFFYAVNPVSD